MPPQAEARADMILELFALSGDFPASLLSKMDGSDEWTQKIVRQLIKSKLIRRYQKDKLKSLRLTKKGRDILLDADRERFCMLLEGAGQIRAQKSDLRSRIRQHRLASIFLMMLETGVMVHRDEKADLFGKLPWEIAPASVLEKWSLPCFYSSVEIKAHGKEYNRVKGTRAVGVLFTDSPSPYLVYHTGAVPIKWSEKSEQKMSGVVEGTLINWKMQMQKPHGLMFGDDMDVLLKLLTSDGGIKNYYYKVDDAYPVFHYFPLDRNGKILLHLFYHEDLKRKLREQLTSSLASAEHYKFHCDALDNGRPVLSAWDMDMVKLKRYRFGLEQYKEQGRVLCMDFQAEAMHKYFGNRAVIEPLDSEQIRKEMLDGT